MKKQILNEEFLKMQKLAGLITESEYKAKLNENVTAEELYQMFKDEDLLNDRREYDAEDFMWSYPDLSQEEAEKLEKMLQDPSKLNENKSEDLEVKWTPEYYKNKEEYVEGYYHEMGLVNAPYAMVGNKKVKEIVGYFYDDEENEDEEIIGYIFSKSGKDIESYSGDELDDAFMKAVDIQNNR
jgi:hypothetical protein